MNMELKFYRCPICGNIIIKLVDGGPVPVCCGRTMQMLEANTRDASTEKHVPHIVEADGRSMKIAIGAREHPMTEEHHIEFICLQTETGIQVAHLKPDQGPHTCFSFRGKPKAVYEYCNLHGLWKLSLEEECGRP